MRKPSLADYLIGNIFVTCIIALMFAYTTYQALFHGGSPWIALAMMLVVSYAASANRRVEAYRLWKREWDAMGGQAPKAPLIRQGSVAQALTGAIVFGVLMVGFIAVDDGSNRGLFTGLFVIGEIALFAIGVHRWRKVRSPNAKPTKDIAVATCLAVPRRSPDARLTAAILPDYCRRLLTINVTPPGA